MATSDIVTELSNVLREELPSGARETLPSLDPVAGSLMDTSMGVKRSGFGRDWEVLHTLQTSLAGGFKWMDASPDITSLTHPTDTPAMPSRVVTYNDPSRALPGISDVTHPGLIQSKITLVQGAGTLVLPLHLLQTNELSSTILDYVALTIKLSARLFNHMHAQSFFSYNEHTDVSNSGAIAYLDADGTKLTASDSYADNLLQADLVGSPRTLYPGMMVDIYVYDDDADSMAKVNSSGERIVVENVDYLNKTVTLADVDGSSDCLDIDDSTYDGDDSIMLVPRDSHGDDDAANLQFYGPSGLEDYLVTAASGTTVLNVDTGDFPQLGSLTQSSLGDLDEDSLDTAWGLFEEAYGGMHSLDTIITNGPVARAFRQNAMPAVGAADWDRNGRLANIKAGYTGDPTFAYRGRERNWMISHYCRPGTLYGVKMKNNWKRYTPPRIKGAGSHSSFDGMIQFVAPLGGIGGVFKNAHTSSGATSEWVEAPYVCFMEHAPEQPQGIKITGITESTSIS